MADLGSDCHCLDDLEAAMPLVAGRLCLAQALARRLMTPRGRMPWWGDYGTDLRDFLLAKSTPETISAAAVAECLKDERVDDVTAECVIVNNTIMLTLSITDSDGPFDLVLAISEAKTVIVELAEAA